jgi:hypothetical protein
MTAAAAAIRDYLEAGVSIVRIRGAGTGWAMLGQATKMGWNGKWATMVFDCFALFISFSFSISSSSVFEKSFGSVQNT